MEVSLDIEIVTMKKGISMNDETHGVRCVSQGGVPGPDPHPPLCVWFAFHQQSQGQQLWWVQLVQT